MTPDNVKKLKPLDRLTYWIRERERVRLRKEAGGPAPWTDDPILRTYRFCNVRRMDDKVSRWLLENWYEPYHDHPNMLVACALARQVNTIGSLEEVGFPERFEPERIQEVLEARQARGETTYSAAYMITANYGTRGRARETKPYQTAFRVLRPLLGLDVPTGSMRAAWSVLLGKPGFSSFIAGQVVADLRHALSGTWADRFDWAPAGPGSTKGINIIADRPETTRIPQAQFLTELRDLIDRLRRELDPKITVRLEAHDYQNCLCEFSKYERTLWGRGSPKQLYPGGGVRNTTRPVRPQVRRFGGARRGSVDDPPVSTPEG